MNMEKSKEQLLVCAAIIEKNGKFLITQRPNDGRSNGGRWEFPGGTVDFGEDPRACLKREIFEELGVDVVVGEILDCSSNVYHKLEKDRHVVLLGYHCVHQKGEIEKKDILDYKFVTLDEMDDYDITDADLPFISKLKQHS